MAKIENTETASIEGKPLNVIARFLFGAARAHCGHLIALFAVWGTYFAALFPRLLQVRADGVWAGHVNVWSDWAMHIAIANIFAFKSPGQWFAYHPLYAGGKFTYPIGADFISGMLLRTGLPLNWAFILPSILTVFALLAGLYTVAFLITRSKNAALVAVSLFLLSAGTGFTGFLRDFFQNPSLQSIFFPIREYSRFDVYDWYAGNVIVGLLGPQRAFLLGMTTALWAMAGMLATLMQDALKPNVRKALLFGAGVLAGIMPVIHPHGFIVLIIVSGVIALFSLKQWRILLWYVVPATVTSSVLFYVFIYGGIENRSFASWFPGWTAKGGVVPWLAMWWRLFGVATPLAIVGAFFAPKDRAVRGFFFGMITVFIAANLFLFQPIRWDNSKLFFWVYFGFSCFTAITLARLWRARWREARVAVLVLFILLTATGALEVIRVQGTDKNAYLMTSSDDIRLGLEVRARTAPMDRFLTAPSHNHWAMVWGARPILLGYLGWAWNYGFLYEQRYQDMLAIYRGDKRAEELLRKYDVRYIVVGPGELYDMRANEEYFSARYPVAFSNASYRVYDVLGAYASAQ